MLFDFVVLFGLGKQEDKPNLGVNVLHCYPAPTPGNEPFERAGDFCFPDLDNFQRSFQPPPQEQPPPPPPPPPQTQDLISLQSPTETVLEPQPQVPSFLDALLEASTSPVTADVLLDPQTQPPLQQQASPPESSKSPAADVLLNPQASSPQPQTTSFLDALLETSTADVLLDSRTQPPPPPQPQASLLEPSESSSTDDVLSDLQQSTSFDMLSDLRASSSSPQPQLTLSVDPVLESPQKSLSPFEAQPAPQKPPRPPLGQSTPSQKPRPPKIRPKRPPPARPVTEGLTLLLTDQAGSRRMGYCQRIVLNGSGPKHIHEKSVCICILTSHQWSALFRSVLHRLAAALESSGWATVESLAAAMRAETVPEPGHTLVVPIPDSEKMMVLGKRPRDLLRPAAENPRELYQCLGPVGLVSVFVAALLERRVLVTGTSLEKVSRAVLAVCGLLYPFKWQHICITMLIPQLLDYVYSPIPFVLGAQKYHYEAVRTMLDDVVVVDLDAGTVTDTAASLPGAAVIGGATTSPGPAAATSPKLDADPSSYPHIIAFRQSLGNIPMRGGAGDEDEDERIGDEICGRFCKFLAKMIGHYDKFFRREPFPMEGAGEKMRLFDTKTFLKFHGKSEKRFLEYFVNSQMFEQFVQEKEEELTEKGFLLRTKFDEDVNTEKKDGVVNDGIHLYNPKLFRKVTFSESTPPPRPPKPKSLSASKKE